MDLTDDLDLAVELAREAGKLLLKRFREPASGVSAKSSQTDLVSDADRAAEELIADRLAAARPGDGLLAEEGARSDSGTGRRWVVDPLDGTTNFLYGHLAWCVSIALEDARGGLVAVVHDAIRGETFTAARGLGSRLGGRPIGVREGAKLDTALIATGFGYSAERRAWQARMVAQVLPRVRDIRRGGSAALDLAWVAAGRLDGYYEYGVNHWDWAAGRLLIEEAGGVTELVPGDPEGLVAAGPALLPQLLELVLVRR